MWKKEKKYWGPGLQICFKKMLQQLLQAIDIWRVFFSFMTLIKAEYQRIIILKVIY